MTEVPYQAANEPERIDWRVWWRLARPFSLTASIIPTLVGTAVAVGTSNFRHPELFVAMLVASILIQIATNMFNEYFDYKHGLDTPETVGIAGAIVRGLVPAGRVFLAAVGCFVVAFVLGLYIVFNTSPAVLVAGLASAAGGFLYTGGPLPIAYTPFGELEVFIFMGPVIVGLAYFIQAGDLSASAIWASIPIGCLVASILLANNLRDVVADGKVGRHTIPVTLGRNAGLMIYIALLVGAFVSVLLAVGLGSLPVTSLIVIITAPVPVRLVQLYRSTEEPRPLNAGVRGSAALHARFGLLLALGIACGPLIGWHAPSL
jgi:1,4-dihydroxy-2-naphthoate polyprenyltransferase